MIHLESLLQWASRKQRRLTALATSLGRIRAHPSVVLGSRIRVGRGRLLVVDERTFIGNDFHCMSNATIGRDVMISSQVALIGDDHPFDDPTKILTEERPNPPGHVHIEGNTLIGYGTILVGTITIGRGAIVAAGSLVTSDLAPDVVYAGRPARPLRNRYAT